MGDNYNDKDIVHQVYQQFEYATSFIDSINLRRDIKRCVNFEQGNQWNMDDDVKDFPKITLNIIKQIGKVRKSNILQNEYGYLVEMNDLKSVRKIQDFLKHLSNKLKLKAKDLKVVNDTYTKGTGIIYFYWDADKTSFLNKSGGCLRAEVIDIRRFRVADPYIQDLQDQEYVIFTSRERLDSIKAKYGIEVPPTAEDYTHETEKHVSSEDPAQEFTNVYTKFYRNEEGQVFFTITTETHLLKKPTPLNPFYEGSSKEEPNTMSTMDEIKERVLEKEVFDKYPFASLVFDERDNAFYGIPGALEAIEAQKSINQHFSVYDKGIQDNVLGGFLHKRGVLGEQEITTENGQILQLDLLPGENWQNVFGRIPVNNIPTDALNYSSNLLGVVRQVSGASNVQIGSADYAGQSGKQTQMLLQRARENSNDMALIFNEFKKEQAYIMFLFSKFFYDNEDFSIVEHGYMKDNVRNYQGNEKFNGNNYAGKNVMVDIRVGPAPSFSEYSSMELLGMMVQSGQAPLEVYLTNLPDGYVNNKQELLDLLKNNAQQQIQQLTQQLEQAKQVMGQMSDAYKQVQKDIQNVDTVIQENSRLKTMMADLSAQAIENQQRAAKTNLQMTQDIQGILNAVTSRKKNK
jgi:hypothetical protein